MGHGQARIRKETRSFMFSGLAEASIGLNRDIKRKLSPHRVNDGLHAFNVSNGTSPSDLIIEKAPFRLGKVATSSKPNDKDQLSGSFIKPNTSNLQASIKGKKGIAQGKASHSNPTNAVEGAISFRSSHEGEIGNDGKQHSAAATQFQFSSGSESSLSCQFKGGCISRDHGASNSDYGLVPQESTADMEAHPSSNGEECEGGRFGFVRRSMGGSENSMVGPYGRTVDGGRKEMSNLGVQHACSNTRNGDGSASVQLDSASRGGANKKDGKSDRMDLEGGGQGASAF